MAQIVDNIIEIDNTCTCITDRKYFNENNRTDYVAGYVATVVYVIEKNKCLYKRVFTF